MGTMDRALTIFIYVWGGLIVLANVLGIIAQFWFHGLGGGISYIQEVYSPFNVTNYAVTLVMLSPAIGAYYWRENRREKRA
jgi:hypothetical protein